VDQCKVLCDKKGPGADHYPIWLHLQLPTAHTKPKATRNFRATDWEKFRPHLENSLKRYPVPDCLQNEAEFRSLLTHVTSSIQSTIEQIVPICLPLPDHKRWWTKELTTLKRSARKVDKKSEKWQHDSDHPAHQAATEANKIYSATMEETKTEHWKEYLLERAKDNIFKAARYAMEPATDGSKSRVHTLRVRTEDHPASQLAWQDLATNEEKGNAFAQAFFPRRPDDVHDVLEHDYPEPVNGYHPVTREQIQRALARLSPYKAPGHNGIPNVVLQKCADILEDFLLLLYRACFDLETYTDEWRTSITAVLRKPGKDDYSSVKAYRPIALLSTLAKCLLAIVAEDLIWLAEMHRLLPDKQFGGRPGRTTTDAIQALTDRIKAAWRKGRVASVLYLDVESAFPNATSERLMHSLRKRRIPAEYIAFVQRMLTGRSTIIRFDDFESKRIALDNGIGQGCPLSMVHYLFYNADLVEVADKTNKREDVFGFVNNVALYYEHKDAEEAAKGLEQMMTCQGGAFNWSVSHNSPFSVPKFVHVVYTRRREPGEDTSTAAKSQPLTRRPLLIRGQRVKPALYAHYLGVLVDQELRWKEQAAAATAKGTTWVLAYQRLARSRYGLSADAMRKLYISVAIPKILYAADVWITPMYEKDNGLQTRGSTGVLKSLLRVQRQAALAITGAICSTPTDLLEAMADLMPMDILVQKHCFNAATRMAALPKTHPLYKRVQHAARTSLVRNHPSALNILYHVTQIMPENVEKIPAVGLAPSDGAALHVEVAESRKDGIQADAESAESSDIRVYTDGSGYKGGIGAAAVLKRPFRNDRVLRYYLGKDTEHTVYEAETVAMAMGLHLIRTEQFRPFSAELAVDNQAALTSVRRLRPRAGFHSVAGIWEEARAVKRKWPNVALSAQWVPVTASR
jgi:hypothetical protein